MGRHSSHTELLYGAERALMDQVSSCLSPIEPLHIMFACSLSVDRKNPTDPFNISNIHLSYSWQRRMKFPVANRSAWAGIRVPDVCADPVATLQENADAVSRRACVMPAPVLKMRVFNSKATEPVLFFGQAQEAVEGHNLMLCAALPLAQLENVPYPRMLELIDYIRQSLLGPVAFQYAKAAIHQYLLFDLPTCALSLETTFLKCEAIDEHRWFHQPLAGLVQTAEKENRAIHTYILPFEAHVGLCVLLHFTPGHPLHRMVATVSGPVIIMKGDKVLPYEKMRIPVCFEYRVPRAPSTVQLIKVQRLYL